MKRMLFAAIAAATLTGCALTPDQLRAIGESKAATTVCFHAKSVGFESTTVVTNAGDGSGKLNSVDVVQGCATRNTQGVIPVAGRPE